MVARFLVYRLPRLLPRIKDIIFRNPKNGHKGAKLTNVGHLSCCIHDRCIFNFFSIWTKLVTSDLKKPRIWSFQVYI